MAQVILIENNKTMNELLTINLTTYLGVDLIHRKNAEDAISLLNLLPNVDLIISNHKVEEEDTGNMINQYLVENSLSVNLLVIGGHLNLKTDNSITLSNEKDWESIIKTSAKILGISEDVILKRAVPDYIPVPVNYFLNLDSVNCDVFIRIKKSPTEYQYIKRIHQGDSLSTEIISRYIGQGLDFFYVPKDHHQNFATYLSNRLVNIIESDKTQINDKIQVMGESYEIASRDILGLGFTRETIQLTDTIIENMINNFKNVPQMSTLLHKLINSKTGFLYQRSHMTSVVACEVIKNLKLADSKEAQEMVAFAAFFSDILLTEHENLARLNSMIELENANLTTDQWEKVYSHAYDASNLVKNHPDAPAGASDLIRHHHGSYSGRGFSDSIDNLPDLSKIFYISSTFVHELMRYREQGGELRPITDELYKKYPSKEIALIIKALEKTLKNKQ